MVIQNFLAINRYKDLSFLVFDSASRSDLYTLMRYDQ
jgi:hypothetical protein